MCCYFLFVLCQTTEVVLPPIPSRLPGRPKAKRFKGADEKENNQKLNKCGKCAGFGHNARTCKGGNVVAKPKPKQKKMPNKDVAGPSTSNKGRSEITIKGPTQNSVNSTKNKVKKRVFKPPRQNYIP